MPLDHCCRVLASVAVCWPPHCLCVSRTGFVTQSLMSGWLAVALAGCRPVALSLAVSLSQSFGQVDDVVTATVWRAAAQLKTQPLSVAYKIISSAVNIAKESDQQLKLVLAFTKTMMCGELDSTVGNKLNLAQLTQKLAVSPPTHILPLTQSLASWSQINQLPGAAWVLKPACLSNSESIQVITNRSQLYSSVAQLSESPGGLVLQQYIEQPLLLGGHKV